MATSTTHDHKVLVTGASGFVGSHVVNALLDDGIAVRVLLRSSERLDEFRARGAEVIYGDLLDMEAVKLAVRGCHTVYHLAARMLGSANSRGAYFPVNVEASRQIARACADLGVKRLVLASSSGVHGIIHQPPVNEQSAINPSSAYRESKWLAEQAVRQQLGCSDCEWVIARLSGLMGPGSLNWLGLCQAIDKGHFRIIGDGRNHDNVAYIGDIVQGLRLCAETAAAARQVYLLGGNPSIDIRRIVKTIAAQLGVKASKRCLPVFPYRVYNSMAETYYRLSGHELPAVHRNALFLADKVLDLSKAERELGYQPQVPFETGLKETIDWYLHEGLLRPRH